MALPASPGFITGLVFEADILRAAGHLHVACHGPGQARAQAAAEALVARNCDGLVSFGVAGALAPGWQTARIIIPEILLDEQHRHYVCDGPWRVRMSGAVPEGAPVASLLSVLQPALTPEEKQRLHRNTGAVAIDMESAAIATVAERHGLPFIVLRVILDEMDAVVPPSAMKGMRSDGTIDAMATVRGLLRHPRDLPALLRLARANSRAARSLARLAHLAIGGRVD
ncbi:hopanoid-associated phosphorylase [Rhodoligotrophos appendicifer]|uniref:phosphorylase family protein n=1 Tax=Rhodoligotrophos appendicifer TaxID=987056 RepID=UPI0011859E9E|nr:squalene--hopene cyclase [Rhodoligotrophos appendicifer]